MSKQNIRYLQNDTTDEGGLQIQVETPSGRLPIQDAEVEVSYTGEPESAIEKVTTNSSGQTERLELKTPPLEYGAIRTAALCGIYHSGEGEGICACECFGDSGASR